MIRKLRTLTAYNVQPTEWGDWYDVTLERLGNDRNGNARYRACVTLDSDAVHHRKFTHVYTFTGHQYSEEEEALFIAAVHEQRQLRLKMGKE